MASEITCPKCGFTRPKHADVPEWQCPACGIAYAKYDSYLKKRRALKPLQPRPPDTDVLGSWASDSSLWTLLAANALTWVLALMSGWTLQSLLLVYWGQSVIIGIAFAIRILNLDRFSTEGLKSNGRQPDATPATKRSVAFFFLMHYGLFHVIYLGFLVAMALEAHAPIGFDVAYWLAFGAFAVNHAFSLRYNMEVDRGGRPNIGSLMLQPYLRVVPMHLILIFGANMEFSGPSLSLFVVLKTVADLAMHVAEHAYLARMKRQNQGDFSS